MGKYDSNRKRYEDSVALNADSGVAIVGVRNDAAASKTSADGDYSMIATDAAGRVGIADLGGSITVDGIVAVTAGNTFVADQFTGDTAFVSPLRDLSVATRHVLLSAGFEGTAFDTKFWTETDTGGGFGSNVFGGAYLSTSGVAFPGSANLKSNKVARYVPGELNHFHHVGAFVTQDGLSIGVTNNTRRVGVFTESPAGTPQNGLFFEVQNTTFNFCIAMAGTITRVAAASFSRGAYVLTPVRHRFEIIYGIENVYVYIDGVLVHQAIIPPGDYLVQMWPITADNRNTAVPAQAALISINGIDVATYADLREATDAHYQTTATTTVLKQGAGMLKRVNILAAGTGTITLYDNNAASGTIIASFAASATPISWAMDFPFNIGLTLITTAITPNVQVFWN